VRLVDLFPLLTAKRMLVINCSWSEVQRYVETTRINADREKNALGFLPPVAYEQAARQGNLYVATENGVYVGHLLFGGEFPRAKIFQLYVADSYRKKGAASLLLRKLESELEKNGFLTISAGVAADLPTNAFWEKSGFPVLNQRKGGSSRRRTINVRVKDLNTPHLFKADQPAHSSDLNIISRYVTPIPVYVLDLNVFWDVIRSRPRSDYARQVVGAALDNFIRIVVSAEFLNELRRNTRAGESDPALEFALQLPALPMPPDITIAEVTTELAALIFPTKPPATLSEQDRSDLIHLATAIHHRTSGFLTSDDTIVNARSEILAKYGLEVFHVREFANTLNTQKKKIVPLQARVSGETLKVWEIVSRDSAVWDAFLDAVAADQSERQAIFSADASGHHIKRVAVTSEKDVICLAYWDPRGVLQGKCTIRILADEEHPACETALDTILNRLASEISADSPVILELEINPGGALVRKTALLQGFKQTSNSHPYRLSKICVGRPIYESNFAEIFITLKKLAGLCLPTPLPEFSAHCQLITLKDANGLEKGVELGQLEQILSPVVFALAGRVGVIVPIQRVYAEQLFGTSTQMSFIPGKEAVLFSERVYLSSPRNVHTLAEGSILLFYESGGNGGATAVIATARCLGTQNVEKRDVPPNILRRGVIEDNELNGLTADEKIAVTRFDNVMLLPRKVSLSVLRDIGCVDGSNLITARRITDKQTAAIFREAYDSE
jgi:GNAT superfamily N-acetyltransferase/predicted nucleic acid-binding protein